MYCDRDTGLIINEFEKLRSDMTDNLNKMLTEIDRVDTSLIDLNDAVSTLAVDIYKELYTDVYYSKLFPINGYPVVGKGFNVNTKGTTTTNTAMYAKFTVTPGTVYYVSGNSRSNTPAYSLGAFFDADMNQLEVFGSDPNTTYERYRAEAPDNAAYMIVNGGYYSKTSHLVLETVVSDNKIEAVADSKNSLNHWYGKKVVLLGTSVGYGQNATTTYIEEAAKRLGFHFVNTSVPGMAITIDADGTPAGSKAYSSVMSASEYKNKMGYTVPTNPEDNKYFCTWETIFTPAVADADLFVFAVAPNNENFGEADYNTFDLANWRYTDGSDFATHRTTFIGGLIYLLDKMYSVNPNARVMLLIDSNFRYTPGSTAFETISKAWKIPYVNLWGKINGTPQSLAKMYSLDGTDEHPSTEAHKLMGMMLANEMLNIA